MKDAIPHGTAKENAQIVSLCLARPALINQMKAHAPQTACRRTSIGYLSTVRAQEAIPPTECVHAYAYKTLDTN
jgi:hypothetical protein